MPRESKTIQLYPDDELINRTIKEYETFGWELVGNQRCQEYTGQTYSGDTTTNHYSTFNKLTFSRDRDARWYKEVLALERQYEEVRNEYTRIKKSRPKEPYVSAGWFTYVLLVFPPFLTAIAIIRLIWCAIKKKKVKKETAQRLEKWQAENAGRLPELENLADEILRQAEAAIMG